MGNRKPETLCPICGWAILASDGKCYRTELHWTRESLEAEVAKRRARRPATLSLDPNYGEPGVYDISDPVGPTDF